MPQVWDEFTNAELCAVLAGSRHDADTLLDLAHDLEVKLPGTKAAFRDGIIGREKAEIIARATALLDPQEARAAERRVLGRAGWLAPAGLRSAIARAVIAVAPDKARKRREKAARQARVERWAEVSGNAALADRELPPPRSSRPTRRSPPGPGSLRKPAWTARWMSCAPGLTWTCCSAPTPAPARAPSAGTAPARAHRRPASSRPGSPGRSP
jgi:hypothetical protein